MMTFNPESRENLQKQKVRLSSGIFGTDIEIDISVVENLKTTHILISEVIDFKSSVIFRSKESKKKIEEIFNVIQRGRVSQLSPILVREYKDKMQIIDGHHRFRAYKMARMTTIPAKIIPAEEIEEVGIKSYCKSITKMMLKRFGF